jgi:Ca-activated chloride channel family protein
MFFNRSLSTAELAFIGCFLLLYTIYVGRTAWLARRLRTTARAIILKFVLRTFAFGLLILALLEPSFGEAEADLRAVGRDIFLVVDVSRSMDARDVQPSRLEKVKFELDKMLAAFPDDRFALIVFAANAYLQCPLTADHGALRLFLESLNTAQVSAGGTAFGPAIRLATQKALASAANQSKAIVLVSDGENFGADDREAIRLLQRNKIPILTLGVGTRSGGGILTPTGPLHSEDGERVVTRLQTDDLQQLAATTGGGYYELTNRRNDVGPLTDRLSKLEGRVIDQRRISVSANKYAYFLVAALVLLALDVLIRVRAIRL